VPSTEQFTPSAPTAECQVCYEQVPSGVTHGAEVLYGPNGARLRGLADAIARYLRIDSGWQGDPLADKDIAVLAIEDVLSVRLEDLVASYRHYGEYGEQCRDEKLCGVRNLNPSAQLETDPICLNEKHVEGTPHSFESEGRG
jgi:hypothetical protein